MQDNLTEPNEEISETLKKHNALENEGLEEYHPEQLKENPEMEESLKKVNEIVDKVQAGAEDNIADTSVTGDSKTVNPSHDDSQVAKLETEGIHDEYSGENECQSFDFEYSNNDELFSEVFISNDEYPIHSIRKEDIGMNEFQYNALDFSIWQVKGNIVPIVLLKDIKNKCLAIGDGIQRYKSIKSNQLPGKYVIYKGDPKTYAELIKRLNYNRRQIEAQVLACFAAEAKKYVKQRNLDLLSEKMKAIAAGQDGKKLPKISTTDYLERTFGVSKTYIADAEKLLANDLKLFNKVKKGELKLKDALQQIRPPKIINEIILTDEPLQIQSEIKPFTILEQGKIKELIMSGVPKKEAETNVSDLSNKLLNVIERYKKDEVVKREIAIPVSINSYLEKVMSDSSYSFDDLITAWVVSYTNFGEDNN